MSTQLKQRPRLWIITELYYPEETSTGYYLTRIAEGLISEFDVKAICGQPNYSARGSRAPKHEVRNGVKIFRAAGTTLNKNVLFFRLINIFTLSCTTFLKCLFRFKAGDRVLVVTTPPSMPFIVALASLIRGASYTLLIHDNYPEMLIAVGKARENSAIVRILNLLNRWLYKHAAKIIVVGRDMRELIGSKTRGLDVPIATIPNWAELETVSPAPRDDNALLRDLGLSDKFVFLYAGNLGFPNDVETLLACAEKLKDKTGIHFIFLGAGVKEPIVRRAINERQFSNITLLAPKPRSEQIVFLNACDVALVSLVARMRGVSMPSRTYNILAAGKPILAIVENDTELTMILDEEGVGWSVPPGETELLYQKILEIYLERETLGSYRSRARQAAITKYSLETAIERYRTELS